PHTYGALFLFGPFWVCGMDELHERPRQRFALGIPENGLDCRIHMLPISVEAGDDDHLRSDREVPLDLVGRGSALCHRGEHPLANPPAVTGITANTGGIA